MEKKFGFKIETKNQERKGANIGDNVCTIGCYMPCKIWRYVVGTYIALKIITLKETFLKLS